MSSHFIEIGAVVWAFSAEKGPVTCTSPILYFYNFNIGVKILYYPSVYINLIYLTQPQSNNTHILLNRRRHLGSTITARFEIKKKKKTDCLSNLNISINK